MKMSRHELLLRHMDLETIRAFGSVEDSMTSYLSNMTLAELQRQAGILGLSVISKDELNKISKEVVNSSFHNAHFSDRVWEYQGELLKILNQGITKSMLLGKNPTTWMNEMRRNLLDGFNGSANALKRLAVTESGRVQVEAQKEAYIKGGYEEFMVICEPTACDLCLPYDGKIGKVKEMIVGKNAPVFHPFCKCSTSTNYSDEQYQKDMDELLGKESLEESAVKLNMGSKTNEYFFGDEGYKNWKNSLNENDYKALTDYTSNLYKDINAFNRKNFNWADDGDYGKIIEKAERFMKNPPKIDPQKPDELFFDYRRRVNAAIPPEYTNAISSKETAIRNTKQIDEIISRFELKDNLRTFRAVEPNAFPEFEKLEDLIGKTYSDPSFMSTTPTLDSKALNKDYIMEIYVPKGVGHGAYLEEFTLVSKEYEFLLPMNSQFEITGVRKSGGKNYIKMEMKP